MALQNMQAQLLALQNQINQAMEEKKQAEDIAYKGQNMKVILTISNKPFYIDTDHLFHKSHGNTRFISTFTEQEKKEDEGSKSDNEPSSCIRLEFQRDPELFQYIINYLNDYNMEHALRELSVVQLEKLQCDATYYGIGAFSKMITQALYARFDPYLGSPFIDVTKENCTVAMRTSVNSDLWQSTAVYGAMYGTTSRYVEINIVSNISNCIMFGVTEAKPFRVASFPGGSNFPGCSYYCNNGCLYRSASSEGLGASCGYGDRVGALLKLNAESDMASIAFYKNGKLQSKEINLKNYLDVSKGVVFVVALHNANEYVQLVQNPVMPQ